MKKLSSRVEYFKEKKGYVDLHIALLIVRLTGLALYAFLLTAVTIYSINPDIIYKLPFTYSEFCNVTKIVYPIYTIIWIILRVIYSLWKKRLTYYKKQLEIIDEV